MKVGAIHGLLKNHFHVQIVSSIEQWAKIMIFSIVSSVPGEINQVSVILIRVDFKVDAEFASCVFRIDHNRFWSALRPRIFLA